MSETRKNLRIVAIVVLAVCGLIVGIPLALTALGFTIWIVGALFGLAVAVIKVAVVVAVIYLILVAVRAALR